MNIENVMSYYGGGKRSVQHLTVRELDEAKKYGLSPEAYDELREVFEARQRDKVRDKVKEQLIGEMTSDLRKKVRVEVEQETREKAEQAFSKEVREKLVAEIRAERPNEKDVRAYRDLAREVELDSLAQAHAASAMADAANDSAALRRRFTTPLCYALILACPLVWYEAWQHTSGVLFLIALAAYVVAAATFIGTTADSNSEATKLQGNLRKTASDYFMLAERAKKVRMVELPASRSHSELRDVIDRLTSEKANADRGFHPSAKALDKARVDVRDQLITEMDPERFLEDEAAEDPSAALSRRV